MRDAATAGDSPSFLSDGSSHVWRVDVHESGEGEHGLDHVVEFHLSGSDSPFYVVSDPADGVERTEGRG